MLTLIIPVFNGKKYLRDAVLSALSEEIPGLEVIVIDDGSSDNSASSIQDLPVRIEFNNHNLGLSTTLNRGIELSSKNTQLVAFLDHDDLLAPGGLRWRYEWMVNNINQPGCMGRPAGIINEDGIEFPLSVYPHVFAKDFVPPQFLDLNFYRSGGFYPVGPSFGIFRRDVFDIIGGFNPEINFVNDLDFLFRFLDHYGQIPLIFEPTILRRIHSSNSSVSQKGEDFVLSEKCILQAKEVNARYGIYPTSWEPWELGIRSPI